MRFNSLTYLLFLLAAVGVFWALPPRARRVWLLLTSFGFYASWQYRYVFLLFGTAALNHFGAAWILARKDDRWRGRAVLAANLLILGSLKYADWLFQSSNGLIQNLGGSFELPLPHWVLPLGISFYVFEGISYTVDIMRGRERIHRFWDFQLYMAYFPHLVAGPILRAKEFLPQLDKKLELKPEGTLDGFRQIATGIFLKVFLADNLGPRVDEGFARDVGALSSLDVAVLAVAFGLQIYLDFSSYSRIALGSARLFGLELVQNFQHPYSAANPPEFWNRWHMSLSRWIRDYLFFPLVGKKAELRSMVRAAVISMTICGIWHGAGAKFLAWGLYHGLLIGAYHALTMRRRQQTGTAPTTAGPVAHALSVALTFALVSLGWILFRASSLTHAAALFQTLFTPWSHLTRALPGTLYLQTALLMLAVWASPLATRAWDAAHLRASTENSRALGFAIARGIVLGVMLTLSFIFLRGQSSFIYFQF